MMRSTLAAAAGLAAFLPLSYAQTYSDCNPMNSTQFPCTPDTGLSTASYEADFTQGAAANKSWNYVAKSVDYGTNGAEFTIAKRGQAPTIQTDFYIFYGKVEVTMKSAPGQGIISSIVLQSDDLDEIDWEFLGGENSIVQTNYFGKGNTTSYDRMQQFSVATPQTTSHTYTVDWTKESIVWSIDGTAVRTLNYADANGGTNFPQTPMNVRLGIWAGGDAGNGYWTIQWAGGNTTYSAAAGMPWSMYVEDVKVTNYNPGGRYNYTDKTGSSDSIKILSGGGDSSKETSASRSTTLESAATLTYAGAGIGAGGDASPTSVGSNASPTSVGSNASPTSVGGSTLGSGGDVSPTSVGSSTLGSGGDVSPTSVGSSTLEGGGDAGPTSVGGSTLGSGGDASPTSVGSSTLGSGGDVNPTSVGSSTLEGGGDASPTSVGGSTLGSGSDVNPTSVGSSTMEGGGDASPTSVDSTGGSNSSSLTTAAGSDSDSGACTASTMVVTQTMTLGAGETAPADTPTEPLTPVLSTASDDSSGTASSEYESSETPASTVAVGSGTLTLAMPSGTDYPVPSSDMPAYSSAAANTSVASAGVTTPVITPTTPTPSAYTGAAAVPRAVGPALFLGGLAAVLVF